MGLACAGIEREIFPAWREPPFDHAGALLAAAYALPFQPVAAGDQLFFCFRKHHCGTLPAMANVKIDLKREFGPKGYLGIMRPAFPLPLMGIVCRGQISFSNQDGQS